MTRKPTISIVCLLLCTAVCSAAPDYNLNEVTSVKYHFRDSSVPPQYHRSYVIVVGNQSAKITVDSYGKILAEKVVPIAPEEFRRLIQSIKDSKLSNVDKTDPVELQRQRQYKGCTGGTGEGIWLYKGDVEVFSGEVYHCGGSVSGNLRGGLDQVAYKLKSLIPEFRSLLSVEYK